MPGFIECERCPMRDDPDTPCAAVVTGHRPFCTSSDPLMPEAVRRLSHELAGRPIPTEPAVAFPPLATQARNLAVAIVEAVASGGELATPDERGRRLAICAGCPHYAGGRCRKCGCVARWKVKLAAWHCPVGKF